jgi:hypothetical protein
MKKSLLLLLALVLGILLLMGCTQNQPVQPEGNNQTLGPAVNTGDFTIAQTSTPNPVLPDLPPADPGLNEQDLS